MAISASKGTRTRTAITPAASPAFSALLAATSTLSAPLAAAPPSALVEEGEGDNETEGGDGEGNDEAGKGSGETDDGSGETDEGIGEAGAGVGNAGSPLNEWSPPTESVMMSSLLASSNNSE